MAFPKAAFIQLSWAAVVCQQDTGPSACLLNALCCHVLLLQQPAGEIRAIGEVMLQRSTTVETSAGGFSVIDSMNQNLNVMG
jgi:hypothetical protein